MQNGKTFIIGIVAILFFMISFRGCFKSDRSVERNYTRQSSQSQPNKQVIPQKSPVDILVRDLSAEQNFSIILYDMDYDEAKDQYKHQYNVLLEKDDSVQVKKTDWLVVSSAFFSQNAENMGMELASKKDGKVSKVAAPAGYSNYVGNEKYGHWKERDGNRFWEFYGKYALMSSMFRMATYPVGYSSWNNYNSNYYGRRNYYGQTSNGQRMYGTSSSYAKANTSSSWNNKPSDFKSRVRSNVQRSTASTSTKRTTTQQRTTRSSSRYSSSSTRSRGGSFGK
jgi:hypothetical protein